MRPLNSAHHVHAAQNLPEHGKALSVRIARAAEV
jgi:hypothetical protein